MKKKTKKGYVTGGEIAMLTEYAANLTGDYVNAANYEFTPGQAAPKIN